MAASSMLSSSLYDDRRVVSHVRTYNWPPIAFYSWIFIMLLSASSIMGVFSNFIQIQNQLELPVPWYFPYYVTVGSLGVIYILTVFVLIAQRRLVPAIVMIGAFILFVLWLVGLVVVAIQLFGPDGSVQSNCNLHVWNQNPKGQSIATMAWMQQRTICQSWYLVFAMGLVGCIFLVWIMIMAYQVFANS